jgi:3-hydroxypropanoate dehydrogenase
VSGEPLPDASLDRLFRTARTFNGYLDKPVGEDRLRAVWDLMKWGPTSANMLPARLVWCISDEAKERLAACAGGTNPDKIRKAPVSVVIGMDVNFAAHMPALFPHNPQLAQVFGGMPEAVRRDMALRNSSLQGAYLILAARALGLDTGPMSGFDAAAVEAAFFADTPAVKANFIATLGYGDPATIFDRSPRPDFETFNQVA